MFDEIRKESCRRWPKHQAGTKHDLVLLSEVWYTVEIFEPNPGGGATRYIPNIITLWSDGTIVDETIEFQGDSFETVGGALFADVGGKEWISAYRLLRDLELAPPFGYVRERQDSRGVTYRMRRYYGVDWPPQTAVNLLPF